MDEVITICQVIDDGHEVDDELIIGAIKELIDCLTEAGRAKFYKQMMAKSLPEATKKWSYFFIN